MNTKNLLQKGIADYEARRYRSSIKTLKKVIKCDADSVPAYFYLSLAYLYAGDLEDAEIAGKRAIRLNPAELNAHLNLGVIYDKQDKLSLAIRNYNRELKLNSACFEAHFNLALIRLRRNQWKRALSHLMLCRDNSHDGYLRDEFIALAAQKIRDWSLEEAIYRARLECNPVDPWALNNLGALRNQQGLHLDAIEMFRTGLAANPKDVFLKRNLAASLEDVLPEKGSEKGSFLPY